MNQLERWNLSRSLSSKTYDVYTGDRAFDDVDSDNEYFPLTSKIELDALVSGLEEMCDDPRDELAAKRHSRTCKANRRRRTR